MVGDAATLDAAYTVNLLLDRIRDSLIERNAIPLDASSKNGPAENTSIRVTELLIGADDKVVRVKRMDDKILDNTLLEIGDSMAKILPTKDELPSVAYDAVNLDGFLNNTLLSYYANPLPVSDEKTYQDIAVDVQRRIAAIAGLYTFSQLQQEGSNDEDLVKAAPLLLSLKVNHQVRQDTSLIDIAVHTDVSKYDRNPVNTEELKDPKKLFKDRTGSSAADYLHDLAQATGTTLPEIYKDANPKWRSTALSCLAQVCMVFEIPTPTAAYGESLGDFLCQRERQRSWRSHRIHWVLPGPHCTRGERAGTRGRGHRKSNPEYGGRAATTRST